MANRVNFQIGYSVDRNSLNEIKTSLESIGKMTSKDLMDMNKNLGANEALTKLEQLKASAKSVGEALEKSFNKDLGTLNVTKFNQELRSLNIDNLARDFNAAGAQGQSAFSKIMSSAMTTNVQLKQTHSLLDNMAKTMANTIKWEISSSVMKSFTGSIQQAYGYVKNLDRSLNDIRIVTGNSADQMAEFAVQANKAAQSLGSGTTDFTDAALIYYQQGLDEAEARARAEITIKAANVTQQSTSAVSEQLTAVWNGYKVSAEEAELYVDRLAAVAATTASDLEELSIGMSKVASAAAAMGVSEEQLAAQIATIISVTRQAPESVGTALKTIFMRISDIEAGLDGEVSLGNYTEEMAKMGINVLDANNKLRDMGEVIEEVGGKWENMSREQQIALSQTMAGTRQANNLIALFDNWDQYTDILEVASNATGDLQRQQDIYMEGTQAHLEILTATFEDFADSMLSSDFVNNFVDAISGGLKHVTSFVDAIGGGGNALMYLGSIATTVFSRQISQGILTTINNFQNMKAKVEDVKSAIQATQTVLSQSNQNVQQNPVVQAQARALSEMQQYFRFLTDEQMNAAKALSVEIREVADLQNKWEEAKQSAVSYAQEVTGNANIKLENLNPNSANYDKIAIKLEQMQNAANGAISALQRLQEVQTSQASQGITQQNDWEIMLNQIKNVQYQAEMLANSFGQDSAKADQLRAAIGAVDLALDNVDMNNIDRVLETNFQSGVQGEQELELAMSRLRTSIQETSQVAQSDIQNASNVIRREFGQDITETERLANQMEDTSGRVTQAVGNMRRSANTQIFVGLASSLGQVTFAANQAYSIFKTWNNEDMKFDEQMLQTFTSLGIILPSIPSLFHNIKNAVTGLSTAIGISGGAITRTILAIGAVVTALTVWKTHIDEIKQQKLEDAKALVEAANNIRNEAESIQSLYSSYQSLYGTYKTTGDGKEELIEKTKELCKELNIEIDTLDLLSDNYDKINEKIAEARETQARDNLEKAKEGLSGAIYDFSDSSVIDKLDENAPGTIGFNAGWMTSDEENSMKALQNVVDKFDNLSLIPELSTGFMEKQIGIYGVQADQLVDIYEAVQEEVSRLKEEFKDKTDELEGEEAFSSMKQFLSENQERYNNIIQMQQDMETYAQQLADALAQTTASGLDIGDVGSLEDFEQYRQQYIDSLRNVLEQEGIEVDKERFDELVNEYIHSIDSISEYAQQFDVTEALRNKLKDADTDITNFIQELKDNDKLDLVGSLTFDEGATIDQVRKMMDIAQMEADNEQIEMSVTTLDQAISSLSSSNDLSKLDDDQKALFYEILNNIDGINGMSSAMEEWSYIAKTGVQEQIEWLTHLQAREENRATQSILGEREIYQAKLELLQIQEQQYQEELDNLNKAIEARKEYAELNDIDLSEDEVFQDLGEAAEEAGQKISDTANEILNIQDILNSTDWDFEVTMAGVDEILTVGDSIISESEKIREAAELIGEGFKVAAEDAGQLADIFPAIYDNAQVLADGTVQLSKDTVQMLLGDESAVLEGDTQACVAKIDNQIKILEAKKASSQAELEVARAVAEAGVQLNAEQVRIISENSQKLTQYLIDLGLDEAEANKAVAAAMSGNMDEYNRITAQVANDTSKNLGQSLAQAANDAKNNASNMVTSLSAIGQQAAKVANQIALMMAGVPADVSKVAVGGGSAGGGGFSASTTSGNFSGADPTGIKAVSPAVQDWISGLETEINQYDAAIAQLQAKKAELLSSGNKTQTSLGNASKGLGGDYSPKKGKGGGKKKGSGKKKKDKKEEEPDTMDYLDEAIDRYHDINLEIEKYSSRLSRLQKLEERYFGKTLINNLNKELKLLEKQNKAQQEKMKLLKQERSELRETLSKQGVKFDEDRYISNYSKILKQKENEVNKAIKKYNGMTKKQQEKYKEAVESIKDDYERFKSQIERYDELMNEEIPSLKEEIQDVMYQEVEIKIKKFTMSVELRLEMGEAARDWNEFKSKVINGLKDDDIIGNAKKELKDWKTYFNSGGYGKGSIQTLTTQLNRTVDDIKRINETGKGLFYGNNKQAALDDLEKYLTTLEDQMIEMEELADSIRDAYLDVIDEATDAFDRQVDQYENINDILNHDMNVIGLLYGDDAYQEMDRYYKKIEENNNQELDFLNRRVGYAQKMMDVETDPEAKKKWQDEWNNALSELNDKVEDSIQNLIDKYVNMIDYTIDKLNKKITGGFDLDYIADEWDLINQNADVYYDNVNALYEMQKLENKFMNAIEDSDEVSTQDRLTKIMNEQLGYLREKEKITEYDIKRANMMYDITLKQIALEEAQQNKNQLKLRRDSQGNYTYQYVADDNDVDKTKEELNNLQQDLYNLDKEGYIKNLNDIYAAYNEFQQKIKELYEDQTLSAEERSQKEAMYVEQYGELINSYVRENTYLRTNLESSAFDALQNMYDYDKTNFEAITGIKMDDYGNMTKTMIDDFGNMVTVNIGQFGKLSDSVTNMLMTELVPQWSSNVQKMRDNIAAEGGLIPTCQDAFLELQKTTEEYQGSLTTLENYAGISFKEIADGIDYNIDKSKELLEENGELIQTYSDMVDEIKSVISQLDELIEKYKEAREAAIDAAKAAYDLLQTERREAANAAEKDTKKTLKDDKDKNKKPGSVTVDLSKDKNKNKDTNKDSKDDKDKNKKGSVKVSDVKKGDVLTYIGGTYYYDSYGTSPSGNRGPGKKVEVENMNPSAPYPIAVKSNDSAYGWLKESQLSYKTGGYTGDWANGDEDGKLAFVHKKELILNKHDTENMLSAVNLVRDMEGLFNNVNESIMSRLLGLASINIPTGINKDSKKVEQDVHISASFPNVTDKNEIEQAFKNLVNIASQRAFNNQR